MKTYLDCIPCFLNQALRAGRIATDDENLIRTLLVEVGQRIKDIPLENTPPQTGMIIYELVRKITGNNDPYKRIKKECTEKALELYPSLKRRVEGAQDSLLAAIRISIAGNVIDFGVPGEFDIEEEINKALNLDFAICNYEKFKSLLNRTDEILYIGDNAGETVFDRILIEEMRKSVKFVVREIPVINDATYEDAVDAGLENIAQIISSGTHAPGTVLDTCNAKFRDIFESSKLIISKGQGNYEGLSSVNRPIFFLLKAKCHVIADDIGVNKGAIILK